MNTHRVRVAESVLADPGLRDLVAATGLPVSADSQVTAGTAEFYLHRVDSRLCLQSTADDAPGSLCVDFASGAVRYRRQDALHRQGLVRSLGRRSPRQTSVLDATAGLGSDAFLLAAAGCSVRMLERDPVVYLLLADGLQRGLQAEPEVAEACRRLQLQQGDFLKLADGLQPVDVVYLDPMFTRRHKSARSAKGMYLLQELVGEQQAAQQDAYLAPALKLARHRVIVKRGSKSPWLAQRKPDYELKGSSHRFDIYLAPAGAG